jgi:hypothetical protein
MGSGHDTLPGGVRKWGQVATPAAPWYTWGQVTTEATRETTSPRRDKLREGGPGHEVKDLEIRLANCLLQRGANASGSQSSQQESKALDDR